MKDDSSTLLAEISAIFSEQLLIDVASADADLIDSGLLDSANLVELLLHVEERFGFRMPLEDLNIENFRSVARITELVASQRQAA